jgi:hypothetical protein
LGGFSVLAASRLPNLTLRARVAELVDAQDLKSCEGNLVRVRFPPLAPFLNPTSKTFKKFR